MRKFLCGYLIWWYCKYYSFGLWFIWQSVLRLQVFHVQIHCNVFCNIICTLTEKKGLLELWHTHRLYSFTAIPVCRVLYRDTSAPHGRQLVCVCVCVCVCVWFLPSVAQWYIVWMLYNTQTLCVWEGRGGLLPIKYHTVIHCVNVIYSTQTLCVFGGGGRGGGLLPIKCHTVIHCVNVIYSIQTLCACRGGGGGCFPSRVTQWYIVWMLYIVYKLCVCGEGGCFPSSVTQWYIVWMLYIVYKLCVCVWGGGGGGGGVLPIKCHTVIHCVNVVYSIQTLCVFVGGGGGCFPSSVTQWYIVWLLIVLYIAYKLCVCWRGGAFHQVSHSDTLCNCYIQHTNFVFAGRGGVGGGEGGASHPASHSDTLSLCECYITQWYIVWMLYIAYKLCVCWWGGGGGEVCFPSSVTQWYICECYI